MRIKLGILGFALLILFSLKTNAQDYLWSVNVGGAGEERGQSITTDKKAFVYVTGCFTDSVDMDPSANTQMIYGTGKDIYVAKYDSAGNYLWAFSIGGPSQDIGLGIATDKFDNVYVTGFFADTADFDPSNNTQNLISTANNSAFLAKYNPAGMYQWAFQIDPSSSAVGRSVAVDTLNNVYITGGFDGSPDFDPSGNTQTLNSAEYRDVFLAKYTSSGNYQWAFNIGGGGGIDVGNVVTTDKTGNVYLGGTVYGQVDVDPSGNTNYVGAATFGSGLLAKYSSSGNFIWGFDINSSSNNNTVNAICADTLGNVYCTGGFFGTADFDPSGNIQNLSTTNYVGMFIAKYTNVGSYQWAGVVEGGPIGTIGNGIDIDKYGFVYLTGYFDGTVPCDFDIGAGTSLAVSNGGYFDAFVAQYNSFGGFNWVFGIGVDSTLSELGRGLHVDKWGDIYVTGEYGAGTADFDPFPTTHNMTSVGEVDAFIAKYRLNPTGLTIGINEKNNSNNFLAVYPNPSDGIFNIEMATEITCRMRILNVLGEEVHNSPNVNRITQIDLRNFPKGIYVIQATCLAGRQVATDKIFTQRIVIK